MIAAPLALIRRMLSRSLDNVRHSVELVRILRAWGNEYAQPPFTAKSRRGRTAT